MTIDEGKIGYKCILKWGFSNVLRYIDRNRTVMDPYLEKKTKEKGGKKKKKDRKYESSYLEKDVTLNLKETFAAVNLGGNLSKNISDGKKNGRQVYLTRNGGFVWGRPTRGSLDQKKVGYFLR